MISGAGRVFAPRVAVDASGDVAFTWMEADPIDCTLPRDRCTLVHGRIRSAAGAMGAVHTLSDPGRQAAAYDATVGMDDQGDAIFGWVVNGRTTECGGPSCVQTRSIAATGSLTPLRIVVGEDGFIFQRDLQLGVDRSGNAVFSWVRSNPGCTEIADCGRLQTATRSPSGDQTAIETLSAGNEQAFYPALAVAPRGAAAAVWVGAKSYEDAAIEGAVRSGSPSF
jgi:hypothetical protein